MGKLLSKIKGTNSKSKRKPKPRVAPEEGEEPRKTKSGRMRRRRHDNGFPRERYAIVEGKYEVKLPHEKNCSINCSVFLPTGEIILGDEANNNIKLFSSSFEFMTSVNFSDPVQYLGASPNLPLIYAIFPDRVRQLHVDGVNMKKSGFIKMPGECRAMVVNRFDGKAVSLMMEGGYGQVNLLTPGGGLQLELFEDKNQKHLFKDPGPLVVTKNLTIAVADKGQKAVLGVNPQGEKCSATPACTHQRL